MKARISEADRLVVYSIDPGGSAWPGYETSNPRDLAELRAAIRLDPGSVGFRDLCEGQPVLQLYRKGKESGRLSFHHGTALRFDRWESDVTITDAEPLLVWFDAREISGPREEVERVRADEKSSREAKERWLAAMPAPFLPFWEAMRERDEDLEPALLRQALAKDLPATADQIGTLFGWFGSGQGLWSGFPSYEMVAEELLLTYTTPELLAVAEKDGLTQAQLEGAARLFAGFPFGRDREADLALLSPGLRARLLAQGLAGADADRDGRARSAYEGQP
jgi:hypothetical protein